MDVLLVGLDHNLAEMRALIESAGYSLRGEFIQRRAHPDPKYFVGKGKLEDLKKAVEETRVQVVIFAGTIRPSQHYQLEKSLGVQCFDRLRVILEIFSQRAHGREAHLQVELAMLQYEIPILREWIHSAAAGERPGFMAGGEYRVDAYYETVKRKMKKVRDGLEAVRKERARRRDHRQERGFYHVSVAGYANAGKSSLFNALSGEKVLVDDRLFTTLSTTTRALKDVKHPILLTDTVGLVSDVPLWLVEAFHSTFEEVYASDLVLLCVDASDPLKDVESKVDLAATTLLGGMDADQIQPLLTKLDNANAVELEAAMVIMKESTFSRPVLAVSALTGAGLDDLRNLIVNEFHYPVEVGVRLTQGNETESFLSWLYRRTSVLSVTYSDGSVEVRLRCRDVDLERIRARAQIVEGPQKLISG